MGFLIGILKRILKLILYSAIVITIILLIPNLPPYTKFTSIETEPTQQLVGLLAPNAVLNNAEHLFKDKLLGPEAFQVYNDEVYTTLATGEIVKFSSGGHVTFVTKIGEPCTGLVQEHICGRPLGFVIDEKNKLMYVADAYYGIWKVNLVTDKKQLLVSPRVAISGRKPQLFNSIALGQNGDLYWTDSTSQYHLKNGMFALICDPAGRFFHYNAAKNESKVLLDDIWFANGVVISPDNQFAVVSETNKQRLIKYYLNGPKKGKSEIFIAGLPGYPDNIRSLPDGSGLLLSLYSAFDEDHPMITKTMTLTPLVRKFIARVLHLTELSFQFLNDQFHHHIFEEIVHKIGNFASASFLDPGMTGLIQTDWNGNIVATYYNTDGSLHHISDAIVFKDKLYTGCPHTQNYVGVIPAPPLLKKAFSSNKPAAKEQPKLKVEEIPKVAEKVSKQQQKTDQKVNESPQKKNKVTEPKVISKETEVKPKVTKEPEVQPKVVVKEAEIKPKVVKKEAEVKPQVVTKEAEVKPKVVTKEAEVKPKVVTKEAEVKPKVVTKEAEVKPKVVTKEAEVKPKVVTKEAEVKSKVVTKEAEVKPKVVTKEAEVKPQVVTKEAEVKPKVVTKEAEVKPKVVPDTVNKKPVTVSKEPEVKHKEPAKNPNPTTKAPVVKANVVPKEQDTKPKDTVKIKPDSKKSETKAKPTKDADPKSKSVPKESGQAKTVPKQVNINPDESVPKPATKPIPVEEKIPSDTVKPSRETLKVIKKSGPQEIPNPHV